MAEVHQLITLHGVEEARRLAGTKLERQAVETAYQVLSDDAERMGFTFSGFALTSLPHRDPGQAVWRRDCPKMTLLLESGLERNERPVGLPYGSYARFILLFLQTEAIKTRSREIELGRSMRVWLGSMGLSIGGATYKAVTEQARRISACRLTFITDAGGKDFRRNSRFVKDSITMSSLVDDDQQRLWQDSVVLDEDFYQSLRDHPVPVSEAALRAIGPRSMVIDIYIWLAYRLHALKDNTPVSWTAVYGQFGQSYARTRKFRENFLDCLELALAAYPDARVSTGRLGLTLHPSKPPLNKA